METRRGFFGKIKAAVVGVGAVAAGIAAIPALEPVLTTIKVPQTSKPITYAELEKAWMDAYQGGDQPDFIYTTKEGLKHWNGVIKEAYNGRNS